MIIYGLKEARDVGVFSPVDLRHRELSVEELAACDQTLSVGRTGDDCRGLCVELRQDITHGLWSDLALEFCVTFIIWLWPHTL